MLKDAGHGRYATTYGGQMMNRRNNKSSLEHTALAEMETDGFDNTTLPKIHNSMQSMSVESLEKNNQT